MESERIDELIDHFDGTQVGEVVCTGRFVSFLGDQAEDGVHTTQIGVLTEFETVRVFPTPRGVETWQAADDSVVKKRVVDVGEDVDAHDVAVDGVGGDEAADVENDGEAVSWG